MDNYDRAYFLFDCDGTTYGLEVEQEREWADNMREMDDGCLGTFACFDSSINLDEAGFSDVEEFISYFQDLDARGIDYVLVGVRHDSYIGTYEFCGEVLPFEDYDTFIYTTAENPYWNGHDVELRSLESEVKYQEIYNLGNSLRARIVSLADGYSWEDLQGVSWDGQLVLQNEDSCGGIIPDLDKYAWFNPITIDDAETVLDCFGWSYTNLRQFA